MSAEHRNGLSQLQSLSDRFQDWFASRMTDLVNARLAELAGDHEPEHPNRVHMAKPRYVYPPQTSKQRS